MRLSKSQKTHASKRKGWSRPGSGLIYATIITLFFLITPVASAETDNQGIQDSDITLAVIDDLSTDDLVSAHLIDVGTKDGIVTLSGAVDNLLSKDIAVQIAGRIKGVRGVIDEIDVKTVKRPDDEIRTDVLKALILDPTTSQYDTDVEVAKGVATLSGKVNSWAEKQLVEDTVKGVKGVKGIKNELSINININRPDSEIKAEIEHILDLDPYLNNGLVDVNVQEGRVSLTGTVSSVAEKTTAYNDAWAAGIKSVDISGLEVKWWMRDDMHRGKKWAPKSDKEITDAINDAFEFDPRVKPFRIDVQVNNGDVVLSGTVGNLKAKKAAEQDAKDTIGVGPADVKNYLRVRLVNPPSDSEITENIQKMLSVHPILERHNIIVLVRNQKVYLYGVVDYLPEKNLAESVASGIKGVVDVENNITVRKAWKWRSDNQVKKSIKRRLFWSPFVDSDNISVDVKDGIAVLSGTVNSWYELKSAVQSAFKGGAKSVKSQLKIKQWRDFNSPIYRDPYYWGYYW